MKSGFVSIVGRPNVGKSTLLNNILDTHLAITSNVSGTTRNVIQGIYNDEESQIVFIDTPGIHKPQSKLGTYMNKKAYSSVGDVDVILFMVDVKKGIGKGDRFVLNKIIEMSQEYHIQVHTTRLSGRLSGESLDDTIINRYDYFAM